MDDEEFQHRQMLHEYDTLRTELLQIYEQQSRLIFSATITAIAAFIGALIQIQRPEFPAALILPTGVNGTVLLTAYIYDNEG